MGLFDKRIPYKPFEYPEYYTKGWLKQAQAFWLHTEIPMSGDVKDWNEKLNDKEKNLVGNIYSNWRVKIILLFIFNSVTNSLATSNSPFPHIINFQSGKSLIIFENAQIRVL